MARLIRQKSDVDEDVSRCVREYLEKQRTLARELVEHAQVVGATLTGLFSSPHLLSQHWDVVVVDEASMVSIPAIQLAARCARSHLLLFGDPKQLEPICKQEDLLLKYWPDTEIYAWAAIPSK